LRPSAADRQDHPFTVEDDDQGDADLVAAGLIRKGTGRFRASLWKARRPGIPVDAVIAAVSAERDED
jgi:hypothetical protein